MGNLKNWSVILCTIVLLSACSEATSVETTDPSVEAETTKEAPERLTVEEILEKSIESMADIQSLSAEMNMIQEMSLKDEESYSTNISVYMEMVQEPLNLYQKMTMDLDELGNTEIELYMVEDAVYYKDPMENKWFTYPDELATQLREMEANQVNPEEQLALLLKNAELLTHTEDEDHYIVTVEGSIDLLQSFAQELNGLVHDDMAGDIDQLMLMSDIIELNYTLYIDKESFYQVKMDLTMEFELMTDGEPLTIQTITHATFSDFNAFTEIEVPQAVIESAEEFDLSYSEFEEIGLDDLEEFEEIPEEEVETDE